MGPSGARDRSEVEAVLNLPTGLGRPREDLVREVMQLVDQLDKAISHLPLPENGELVDIVDIIRCRIGHPGPRLVGAKREKR